MNKPKHMHYWHLKDVKRKSKDSWTPRIQLSADQKYPPVPIQLNLSPHTTYTQALSPGQFCPSLPHDKQSHNLA